jgi:hypothetical protein
MATEIGEAKCPTSPEVAKLGYDSASQSVISATQSEGTAAVSPLVDFPTTQSTSSSPAGSLETSCGLKVGGGGRFCLSSQRATLDEDDMRWDRETNKVARRSLFHQAVWLKYTAGEQCCAAQEYYNHCKNDSSPAPKA